MIYSINIKNIALISEAEISFSDGFNVITGETGAGKSVLIGSINMLLGERMSRDIISVGTSMCEVSAVFYIEDKDVIKHLLAQGLDIDETGELVMTRKLYSDGKNVCSVNGTIVNVSKLKEIGRFLVDLHGQHNNQSLMEPSFHIGILDKYAGKKITPVLCEYTELYEKMLSIKKELKIIEEKAAEKERKIDILQYEINEITEINPYIGEDDELKKKKEIIDNFKNLCGLSTRAYYSLYEDSDEKSAYGCLVESSMALTEASEIDETLKETAAAVEEAVIKVQEAARMLSSYRDNLEQGIEIDFDIDARLDELYKLKRKYGGSIEAALSYLEKISNELELINTSEERYQSLVSELDTVTNKATLIAQKLSKIRKEAAKKLEKEICENLHFLNMADAKFFVDIKDCELTKTGCDKVEFMLTTIAGAEKRPLTKIASGGELSRIMLAIKTVLSETDSIKTMIFDEIDTGVSGIAAQKIGDKIKELSKEKQVFCVTHLPQIASKADTHFLIEKTSSKEKTSASVKLLDDEGRINEIARIISGDEISKTTQAQAKEMLGL